MLQHFARAVAQLNDRSFQRVLWLGLAGALIAFVIAFAAAKWALGFAVAADWGWLDGVLDWLLQWSIVPLFLISAYFFFPSVATGIMAAFLDDVVDAVEQRHYPGHVARRHFGLIEGAWLGLRMAAIILLWNLAALPLYAVLLITGFGPVILFVALNGYLLGREYLEMVALRHMDAAAAKAWRRSRRVEVFLLGLAATGLFLIPLVNLFAPLIAAAMAVHLFHANRPVPAAP